MKTNLNEYLNRKYFKLISVLFLTRWKIRICKLQKSPPRTASLCLEWYHWITSQCFSFKGNIACIIAKRRDMSSKIIRWRDQAGYVWTFTRADVYHHGVLMFCRDNWVVYSGNFKVFSRFKVQYIRMSSSCVYQVEKSFCMAHRSQLSSLFTIKHTNCSSRHFTSKKKIEEW